MPSPFPGMDPFLEDPEIFPNLHHALISFLQGAVKAALPAPYFAAVGLRVWMEMGRRFIEPDVDVLRPRSGRRSPKKTSTGVAVLTPADAHPVIVEVPEEEITEAFLNIYAGKGKHILVTSIEVLSPANKTAGTKGQESYLRKQKEMQLAGVNLVEIDLLRRGQHVTAVPEDYARDEAGDFDYHACVQQAEKSNLFHVYPIHLRDRLPVIAIPLMAGEPFISIDLQLVFDKAYEIGPYDQCVYYEENSPSPPLSPEQAAWTTTMLRDKGFLPPVPPVS